MTMENQPPLGDVSPIRNCDVPASHVGFRGGFSEKERVHNHQISPANFSNSNLSTATFNNSTSALAMPSAKFPVALSGWYLTDPLSARGFEPQIIQFDAAKFAPQYLDIFLDG